MQNLAVALNNEIRKRIPFGNMEVQRAVDGTRKLKFERLCYIAKLYNLKLAMKRPQDEQYCFYGERAHEFVKQLAFLFVEKYDDEDGEKLENHGQSLGLKPRFFFRCVQHKISPDVSDIEILADHIGCLFKFVERDYEDMERDEIK